MALTVSEQREYGLRWDINPHLKGENLANDPFTVEGLNDPATLTLAPRGTPLYRTTYGSVVPRLGFAYQFSGIQNWVPLCEVASGCLVAIVCEKSMLVAKTLADFA